MSNDDSQSVFVRGFQTWDIPALSVISVISFHSTCIINSQHVLPSVIPAQRKMETWVWLWFHSQNGPAAVDHSARPAPTLSVCPLWLTAQRPQGLFWPKYKKKKNKTPLPSAQHHALKCLQIKKQPNLPVNEEENEAVWGRRSSEGANRGVSKAFVHLLRHKTANGTEGPSTVRRAVRIFFTQPPPPCLCFMNAEPTPSPFFAPL